MEHRNTRSTRITNSIGTTLQLIEPGVFTMGGRDDDDGKPAHPVTLTQPFYLGVWPVTQAQYEQVIQTNPSHFKCPNGPVEKVSWFEACEFCRLLSQKESGVYRLPTEAEWEYACRAGSTTAYCFGDSEMLLRDYAWFRDNSSRKPHPVGEKQPNAWGFHDMHGNVWEWCQDYWAEYTANAQTDPGGPPSGPSRVHRGGSWNDDAGLCRSAKRYKFPPEYKDTTTGFRVAFSPSGNGS